MGLAVEDAEVVHARSEVNTQLLGCERRSDKHVNRSIIEDEDK
jgi:hypothetical protein